MVTAKEPRSRRGGSSATVTESKSVVVGGPDLGKGNGLQQI